MSEKISRKLIPAENFFLKVFYSLIDIYQNVLCKEFCIISNKTVRIFWIDQIFHFEIQNLRYLKHFKTRYFPDLRYLSHAVI